MPCVSKPMKLVSVRFTNKETAFLDELAKMERVTLSTSRSPSHSFLVAYQSEPVPPSSKVMSTRLSLTL
jgi:hypothetical protein